MYRLLSVSAFICISRFRVDVDDLGEIPPAGGGLGTVRRERRGAGRATTILIEAGERDFPANNSTALLLGAGRERLTFLHSQSLSTTTTLPLPLLAHGESTTTRTFPSLSPPPPRQFTAINSLFNCPCRV